VARTTPLMSLKQFSEINLTPLMDLTFILLITFIITFPLIEQGISVNLPKARAANLSAETARTISVDAAGCIYLDDVPVSLDDLDLRIKELVRASPALSVMVRADEGLPYGKVVEVLKVLYRSGIGRLALVTRMEGDVSP